MRRHGRSGFRRKSGKRKKPTKNHSRNAHKKQKRTGTARPWWLCGWCAAWSGWWRTVWGGLLRVRDVGDGLLDGRKVLPPETLEELVRRVVEQQPDRDGAEERNHVPGQGRIHEGDEALDEDDGDDHGTNGQAEEVAEGFEERGHGNLQNVRESAFPLRVVWKPVDQEGYHI